MILGNVIASLPRGRAFAETCQSLAKSNSRLCQTKIALPRGSEAATLKQSLPGIVGTPGIVLIFARASGLSAFTLHWLVRI